MNDNMHNNNNNNNNNNNLRKLRFPIKNFME